eukprot:7282177-Pyramimonas_sp.AAC.1
MPPMRNMPSVKTGPPGAVKTAPQRGPAAAESRGVEGLKQGLPCHPSGARCGPARLEPAPRLQASAKPRGHGFVLEPKWLQRGGG